MSSSKHYFPPYQTYKATFSDDREVHLVEFSDGWLGTERVVFRCNYETISSSCVWSTSTVPTCKDCLEWFREYLRQLPLPLPNKYQPRLGEYIHVPELAQPVPAWVRIVFPTW